MCDVNPTFPVGASFLDHFLISTDIIDAINTNFQINSLPTFSDHYLLKLMFKFADFDLITSPPKFFKSFENTNWEDFRNDVHHDILSISLPEERNLSNEEIDISISQFNELIGGELARHSSKLELKNKRFIIPESIKKLFKIKYAWQKDLKRIFHRNGNRSSDEYRVLSAQIQLLKTIIKEQVEKHQAGEFNKRIEKIKPGPRSFREVFSFIGNRKTKGFDKLIAGNNTYDDDVDKVEQFKRHFSDIHKFTAPDTADVVEVPNTVNSFINGCSETVCQFANTYGALNSPDSGHFTNSSEVFI